jgi:hypothetical protein
MIPFMKILSVLTAALLIATSAQAAGKGKEKEEKTEVGQYVDLAPVAMPIVADGRLVNYAFTYVRINLNKGANPEKMKAKEPYFRDAMVRMGARTPFTSKKDYLTIDEPRLIAAMFAEATRIAGPGMVKSVIVQSQTPKKHMGLPRMADARGNSEIRP